MRKTFPYVLSGLMAVSLSQIAFAQSRAGDSPADRQEDRQVERRQESQDRQADRRQEGVKDKHADRGGPRTRYGGSNGGGGSGSSGH